MDAWIKIFVVLMLMSLLSFFVGYVLVEPFVGLILIAVLLTLMVIVFEPATGKAMAQVIVPIVIILFVMQVFLNPQYQFNEISLIILAGVLYLMFAVFTGGGGFVEGGFIDAKLSLKLFPLYGIAIFLSVMIDPSRRLTVYLMVGTVFGLMAFYMAFLRDYDKWPQYSEYGKAHEVTAISDINPKGKVKVGAEIWWAKTQGPPISEGERVIVLGVSGLTLLVDKESSSELQ